LSPALSRRERECLHAIAGGASSKMIARQLDLSAHTITDYVKSAMRKLGAGSRTEGGGDGVGSRPDRRRGASRSGKQIGQQRRCGD